MEHDDQPAGRLLARREALALVGMAGAAALLRGLPARAQESRTACVARPQQMEGPFFVETGLDRSDIRSDPATGTMSPGVPLQVRFRVARLAAGGCTPLAAAHVELWQCDAAGAYSGVRDGDSTAAGQKFLRGYQATDGSGAASFTTIYPGWYPGRTVHLHFTIRTARPSGREEFSSQLYFDDALTDKVHALAPYARRGPRPVRNGADGLYRQGGPQLLLAVQSQEKGLAATFDIALASA